MSIAGSFSCFITRTICCWLPETKNPSTGEVIITEAVTPDGIKTTVNPKEEATALFEKDTRSRPSLMLS